MYGGTIDGKFINEQREGDTFKVCSILDSEIRVWGAEGIRALSSEITAALRIIVKRVRPTLPIALMADYHPGEMGVIGSVVVSEESLVPDLIGIDCGCGVYAARTGINSGELTRDRLQEIFEEVLQRVPVGSAQNSEISPCLDELQLWEKLQATSFVSSRDIRKLRYQLGSLGGGNHFIELAVDSESSVWIVVHSGSRYLGGLLSESYKGRSIQLGTDEASQFLLDQEAALEFARTSRHEMAGRVMSCLQKFGDGAAREEEIDLPHNFIEVKVNGEVLVAVHRKGACSAEDGQLGIIPGSMGTGSYIVEGRGNHASYSSSSHGSGRLFSRKEAFRKLSMRDLDRDMKGITWSGSEKLKDEAPRAYKDLHSVIRAQQDLIRVRKQLKPILSVKGER